MLWLRTLAFEQCTEQLCVVGCGSIWLVFPCGWIGLNFNQGNISAILFVKARRPTVFFAWNSTPVKRHCKKHALGWGTQCRSWTKTARFDAQNMFMAWWKGALGVSYGGTFSFCKGFFWIFQWSITRSTWKSVSVVCFRSISLLKSYCFQFWELGRTVVDWIGTSINFGDPYCSPHQIAPPCKIQQHDMKQFDSCHGASHGRVYIADDDDHVRAGIE